MRPFFARQLAAVLGIPLNPDGTVNPALTNDALSKAVQEVRDAYAALQQADTANQALAQQAVDGLRDKASASTVNGISQRVTTLSSTVDTKATTAYVDQQVHAIGDVDASQAAAIAGIKQSLLGDEGSIQTLLSGQAAQKLLLDTLRTDVDTKAPSATVSTLSGQLTTVRNKVNDTTTGLDATKVIADGAASTANTAKTTADAVTAAVGNATTGLAATNTVATQAKNAADALAATVNNASTGLAATYALANTAAAAVPGLKKELMTRAKTIVFTNITSTASTADTSIEGTAGKYVDYLSAGSYKVIAAHLETTQATLAATTITVANGSSTVLQASVGLSLLPAVGALFDLLQITGITLNSLALPAIPTAVSSAGGKFKLTLYLLPL